MDCHMKKLLLIAAFLLAPSVAWAQCNGTFPPNTFCGNTGVSAAPPKPASIPGAASSQLTRAQTPSSVIGDGNVSLSGYRTINDLGNACTYTSTGAVSTG